MPQSDLSTWEAVAGGVDAALSLSAERMRKLPVQKLLAGPL